MTICNACRNSVFQFPFPLFLEYLFFSLDDFFVFNDHLENPFESFAQFLVQTSGNPRI